MKLNEHFDRFHSRISLNPDRKARIDSAYSNLDSFVSGDGEISKILYELFKQGSYVIGTAVSPGKSNQEFDVDVVLALNVLGRPEEERGPQQVIEWLAERLREGGSYSGKVRKKERCVRIKYAGEFHLDVVPAHCNGDTTQALQVPDKENGVWRWSWSHPKGYGEWCGRMQNASNEKFARVVKMVKWWRNRKFGEDSAPKSIVLTTLLGHHIANGCSSDAEALAVTMESMNAYLSSCYFVPVIVNPSLVNENVARDWKQEEFELFKRRWQAATEKAREAYDEEDKGRSISLWQELFGDAFPKLTAEEAKRMEAIARAGTGYVTLTGRVASEKPGEVHVTVPPHGYYGDNGG